MLDSLRPKIMVKDYAYNENRYLSLTKTNPAEAERLMEMAQIVVNQKWSLYEEMATRDASKFVPDTRAN